MRANVIFRLLSVAVIVVLLLSACGQSATPISLPNEVHVTVGDLKVVPTEASLGQTVWIYVDRVEATSQVNYAWTVNGESMAGQNTNAIPYLVPQDARDTILVTVSITAQNYHQELSTVIKISGVGQPVNPTPSPLPPLSCSSPTLETSLSPYGSNVAKAGGNVQYCQSPDGAFAVRVDLHGLSSDQSYLFTIQAAEGDEPTNELLAQNCPDTHTDNGDFYCDLPLDSVTSTGNLQSRSSKKLTPGNYVFKFLLKEATPPNYTVVMNNNNPPPITISASLGIQKGISYVSWTRGEFSQSTSDQALEELAATGANWIALVVTGYQDSIDSKDISIDSPKTPSDDDVQHVIDKARQLGLYVMMKPHINLPDGDSHWRGQIGENFKTAADWSAWFASYQKVIAHYANIAQKNKDVVKIFCVGTELVATSSRDAEWKQIVQQVRGIYDSGQLVYASNWDGEDLREWWKELDYIGVDAYFPLAPDNASPTVDDLKTAWNDPITKLENLHIQLEKPVILTELGYPSSVNAHIKPWENPETTVDVDQQANLYRAALETLMDKDWLVGIYWWNWLAKPAADWDYTPHGKPAEDILKEHWLTIPAPLAKYNGKDACTISPPGASAKVFFYAETKDKFQANLTLSNLTPQHTYWFTLFCKEDDSNCRELLSRANTNMCISDSNGSYCDFQGLPTTDSAGSLTGKIEIPLPPGLYDMKFFIKDPAINSCNLLNNDNPGSFTILNP
jgi:glycosyl hydrolase family 113